MAEPYYTTATKLRTKVGVDATTLPDDAAAEIIETAEDFIDELLGAWVPDTVTGRKVVQANVEAWRFTKLQRATTNLAAMLYANPDLGGQETYRSVSGPDFSMSGRIGGQITTTVLAPLNQSGLRKLGVRAAPNVGTARFARFFDREQGV